MGNERLVDALERTDLDLRSRRITLCMPGMLFGFVPESHDGFVERIDCPVCSRMMDLIDETLGPARPPGDPGPVPDSARERNAAKRAEFARRRAIPIVGRLFREPAYEPEEPAVPSVFERLDALKTECPRHWGDEAARQVSDQLMGSYVHSDRLVHGTVG